MKYDCLLFVDSQHPHWSLLSSQGLHGSDVIYAETLVIRRHFAYHSFMTVQVLK